MTDERDIEIPDSWLDVLRRHRVAATVAATAILVSAVVGSLWLIGVLRDDAESASLEELVPDGSTSGVPTATGDATSAAGSDGQGPSDGGDSDAAGGLDGDDGSGGGSGAGVTQAPFVAYRLDDGVWVAREDGTAAKLVTGEKVGGFSLSADGRSLAHVDTSGKNAVVAFKDVASGNVSVTGLVTKYPNTAFAWLANGDVVCVKDDSHLAKVSSSDGAIAEIPMAAERPVFGASPDGETLAFLGPDDRTLTLRFEDGSTRTHVVDGLLDVAVGYDRVFLSLAGPVRIESMRFDGSGRERIVGLPKSEMDGVWGELQVSPAGDRIVFSELSDDGYSRTYAARVDGGGMRRLWVRRDTYTVRWLSDSSGVLFIEGNAWQGEPTKLMSVGVDGTGRSVLVEDARR
ncbi:MAG: hypothetical protein OEV43_08495 [Coriobacteriia bacterium]|nr:hypothetical protein [Coriobacteriia bacterium]